MEEAAILGDGGGSHHGRRAGASTGDGAVGGGDGGDIDGLDPLWPPSQPSSATRMLACLWEANPTSSERWTTGLGGVE
jgi:hypothetical protein